MAKRLPNAVIAAGLRADELLKSLDEPETVEVVEPASQTPPTVQSTAPQSPEPTTPANPEPPKQDESYWQHRFKTTEGILNSTNKRHAEELRQRDEAMRNMQTQINELATKAVVPKQYDIRQYMSPEDITTFGEDMPKVMLKMAQTIAKETAEEAVTRVMKQELEPVRNQVKLSQEASQQERVNGFWKNLQRGVPNWQEINGDPKFLTWLSEREGFTKFTRDDVLKDAERNLDSDTVVELFQAFAKSNVVPQTPSSAVQRRVIPESSAPTAPVSVDEAPLFTKEQIRDAYSDFARGRYKGKLDEWNKLEKRMNEAISTNRIA